MGDYKKHKKRISNYLQSMDLLQPKNDVVIKEIVEVKNCKLGMSTEDKYVIKLYPNNLIKRDIILSSSMGSQIAAFVQRAMIKNKVADWQKKYRLTEYWKDIPVSIGTTWGKNPQEPNGKGDILYIYPTQPKINISGAAVKPNLEPNTKNWASVTEWLAEDKANTIETVKKKYLITPENEKLLCEKKEN